MEIVFLDEATVGRVAALQKIKKAGRYTAYDHTEPEEVLERLRGADVAITNKVVIDRRLMQGLPGLKLICIAATGMNNVDLDAAAERGIAVRNVAGYSTMSVTQLTFSLLFELMSHTSCFDRYVKSGEYSASGCFSTVTPGFHELNGKVFGVVGLGAIGRRVAAAAAAFGAEVVYYSTTGENFDDEYRMVDMKTLLAESDVISIHAPLNDRTRNLFDYKRLSAMKKGAVIVNAGRGGIIDEAALARVLDEGRIAGACLDVFEKEPLPADNPLLKVKDKGRLVMTPHIAWASYEARERLIDILAGHILDWKREHGIR